MVEIRILYVPCSSMVDAKKMSSVLLEQKLVSCVNIFDSVTSMYFWEGKIAEENEVLLVAKTTIKLVSQARAVIEKIHSYSIPCILVMSSEVNQKYSDWMHSVVNTG
ncbi:MAG: divalent-cation tolerance protein CutA [Candidatus Woesearchaeota archaeon]|nr:divalent-cation tolerance protein CutA [Candidatus Woesearchaeota archaeon]